MTDVMNDTNGTYVGHHGKEGYNILVGTYGIMQTKDMKFGKTDENLLKYLLVIKAKTSNQSTKV